MNRYNVLVLLPSGYENAWGHDWREIDRVYANVITVNWDGVAPVDVSSLDIPKDYEFIHYKIVLAKTLPINESEYLLVYATPALAERCIGGIAPQPGMRLPMHLVGAWLSMLRCPAPPPLPLKSADQDAANRTKLLWHISNTTNRLDTQRNQWVACMNDIDNSKMCDAGVDILRASEYLYYIDKHRKRLGVLYKKVKRLERARTIQTMAAITFLENLDRAVACDEFQSLLRSYANIKHVLLHCTD